jgi:hypothetical protein
VTTRRLSSSLVAARRARATLWHTGRFEVRFEHKDRALLDPESGSAQEYRFGRDPPIRMTASESRRIRSNSAPAVPINLFFDTTHARRVVLLDGRMSRDILHSGRVFHEGSTGERIDGEKKHETRNTVAFKHFIQSEQLTGRQMMKRVPALHSRIE